VAENVDFGCWKIWKNIVEELNPEASASKPSQKPLPRQRHQEQEILRVISELGYDPQALPKWQAGKRGVKAEVKSKLTGREWQGTVFEKAWGRLLAGDGIKYAS
jgi:hypothetical protein